MKENYFLQESGEIAPTYPSPDKRGSGDALPTSGWGSRDLFQAC